MSFFWQDFSMFLGAIGPRCSNISLYWDAPLTIPCGGIHFNHEWMAAAQTVRLYIPRPKSMTVWLPVTSFFFVAQLCAVASLICDKMPEFACWQVRPHPHHVSNSLYDLYRNWWHSVICRTALLNLPKFNNLNAWRFHWVFLWDELSFKM